MRKIRLVGLVEAEQPRISQVMNGTKGDSLNLDPPKFQPPTDDENGDDRYELWTVRLPASVQAIDLEGCTLSLDPKRSSESYFDSDNKKYGFQWGHGVENESFRLLLAAEPDGSDDDTDANARHKFLVPSSQPFSRHVNVVAAIPIATEAELAPRIEKAPPAADAMRHAYEPVHQKTGLKRRWMPFGASLTPDVADDKKPAAKRSPALSAAEPQAKRAKPDATRTFIDLTGETEFIPDTKAEKKAKNAAKKDRKAKKAKKKSEKDR
jgi:DNA-directed RNA polymerase I subunit RPA34.5